MASERILELLRRPVDVDEYTEIRELWKTHSIAEDNRDLPGLISTLTEDCVYEVMGTKGLPASTRSCSRRFPTSTSTSSTSSSGRRASVRRRV
jgi:hypothetical protein